MTPNASPHDETLGERGVYALPEDKQRDFGEIMRVVHETAVDKGWWEGEEPDIVDDRFIATKLMLIVSEVSEAMEELRKGSLELYYEGNKPEGMVVELADAVIRIMDLCKFLGLDLLGCLRLKSAFNDTRPFRHGGKAL